MTNLEIIKYLATNNPARLAELLDDIYCIAWNNGSYAASNGEGKFLEECEIDDFNEWINQDASKSGIYHDYELEAWSKATQRHSHIKVYVDNKPCFEVTPDGMLFNNGVETINTAIDEIHLLENVIETTKHPAIDYVRFRKSVCAYCPDPNCMRSQVEICDCHKFEGYY